jgi:hypothetical protein
MAKGGKFKLDRGGVKSILQSSAVADIVEAAAQSIAEDVRDVVGREEMEVTVTPYNHDRAARSVTIAHSGGLGVQAKRGALTRAAARHGLEVKKR